MGYEPISHHAGPREYTANLDIAALDPDGREATFRDWMLQCWLADNDPPQDEDGLASFDLDQLRRVFPHAYRAGDWRRMDAQAGANMARVQMLFSLFDGEPYGIVTNRTKPIDEVERLEHAWHVPAHHLVAAVAYLLDDTEGRASVPVWLHDGRHGHVIKLRRVDKGYRWFAYDETTWPRGKSLLSDGENVLDISATKVGWPDIGEFVVSVGDLERAIAGISGSVRFINLIRDLADQVEQTVQREWDKFGGLPQGWGDPDLRHHVLKSAIPKFLDHLGRPDGDD